MKKTISLILFLLVFTTVFCQQKIVFTYAFRAVPSAESIQPAKQADEPVIIYGKITEKDTNEGISFAKIYYGKDTATGVTADIDGNFMLEIPNTAFRKKITLHTWAYFFAVKSVTIKRKQYKDSAINISLERYGNEMHPSWQAVEFPLTGSRSGVVQFHNNKSFIDSFPPIQGIMKFTNTGTKPLIIESVHSASSDCIAYFDKEPVLPGKEGSIRFSVLTDNLQGIVTRIISFKTNVSSRRINLQIWGQIKKYE